MKKALLFFISLTILNIACSNTLEDSFYNKLSDPHVDEPVIGSAIPAEESIIVRNIQSQYCEEYYVYYKKVLPGVSQDEIITQDVSLWSIASRIDRDETEDIIIEELEAGELYVIAVIGIDSFGNKSEPVFFEEEGRANIAFIVPLEEPPAPPPFINIGNVEEGDRLISVSDITSNLNADYKYHLYTREIAVNDDITLLSDEIIENWKLGAVVNYTGNDNAIITNIVVNKDYALAIIGKDGAGNITEPFFWLGADNIGNPELLTPYTTEQLAPIQNIQLNLLNDGRTIQVNNIYNANATDYQVQYTRAWENNWTTININSIPETAVQTEFLGAVWETYNIRVRGINSVGGVNGNWSDILQISTDRDNTFTGVNAQWIVNNGQGTLNISIASLPANTSSVKIVGQYSYNVEEISYSMQTNGGLMPVDSDLFPFNRSVNVFINPYIGNVISTNIISNRTINVNDNNLLIERTFFINLIINFEIICENRNGDIINSQNYIFDLN